MPRSHGRELTPKEVCEILAEFMNGAYHRDEAEFVDQLVNGTHRTLQQRVMHLFMRSIEAWAELPEDRHDLRNEATVKLARKIVQATGDKYDRHLPTI